jgi:hypothetical protein
VRMVGNKEGGNEEVGKGVRVGTNPPWSSLIFSEWRIRFDLKILLNRHATLNPILGSSGTMSNGKDPNDFGMDHVSEIVRKHLQIHTAIAIRARVGQLRVVSDPCCRRLNFKPEADTQTGFDILIIGNGIREFGCSLVEDPKNHAG